MDMFIHEKGIRMKKAFTLAEVLITLGIIGIVAALTIPTLMQKTQEHETISKLKKVYATLTNAYELAVNENGSMDGWNITTDSAGLTNLVTPLLPHLQVAKNCGTGTGCFPNVIYKRQDNGNQYNWETVTDRYKIQLSDGTLVMFNTAYVDPSIKYAQIYVDLNGFKKPNKLGEDFFYFYIYKNPEKILPAGVPSVEGNDAMNNCYNSGWNCAAWVLQYENMDYLHCSGLTWGGKTKCD
ncbi:type II secretion system protein [bacterium]|nr:type II secretion system protein [bacterium]